MTYIFRGLLAEVQIYWPNIPCLKRTATISLSSFLLLEMGYPQNPDTPKV